MRKNIIVHLTVFLFFISCTQERFSTPPSGQEISTSAIKSLTYNSCSIQGKKNPAVDILVLIDNSSSTNFISPSLKNALIDSIQNISQEFDYRIYIAPLITPASGDQFSNYPRFSGQPTGSTPLSPPSSLDAIYNLTFGSPAIGGQELGFQRADQLLNKLHTPTSSGGYGYFRNDTHDLIVVMSNGDDTDGGYGINYYATNYEQRRSDLLNRKTAIGSQQFRFISVVAHTSCKDGYIKGKNYMRMSKDIYAFSGDQAQSGLLNPDTYDLCSDNLDGVFTQINQSIKPITENLTYHYWPVEPELKTKIDAGQVDMSKLKVYKVDASSSQNTLLSSSDWEYNDSYTGPLLGPGHNTFLFWSGAALALEQDAYITSPDCVLISAPEKPKYYGYIVLNVEPKIETIKVTLNGSSVPQSSSNGWEYLGFKNSQNILIESASSHQNSSIWSDYRTGYFLKVNGSGVYSDGDEIQVQFQKAPVK